MGISVEGGEDASWNETSGSVKCEVAARTDTGREKIHGYTGKDCYARFLYCAGYAPLKLTEIKLGELMLSHNGGDGNNRPVMHGMLSGCDLTNDKGDILRKWKENEIRIEILQKGSRSELYPQKVKQDTIDANVLHVVEGEIDEISTYKGTEFPSGYRPKIGDIAAFGDIGKITSEYVVGKIEPQDDFKFRLTLWQYSPLMYEYGAALPVFQSNMTIPDRSGDGLELGPSWKDLANMQSSTVTMLQQWVEGELHGGEYEIGPVEVTLCKAREGGIVVVCNPDINVGMRNTPRIVHWEMQGWDKAGDAATWDSDSVESEYMFDRARDGYPEWEELSEIKIRCRVTNIYGKTGAWSDWRAVDTDDYGTWTPETPRLRVKTDNRAVLMAIEQRLQAASSFI